MAFKLGKKLRAIGICVSALLLCAVTVLAQTASTGALTGTVTDPSGGVIAGATVTLTSLGTGEVRTMKTNVDGSYKFPLLMPGRYSVNFEAQGFKTVKVPSVSVVVTETGVLNRALEVGAQTQQVTVSAVTETIQTQNDTLGGLVGSQTVVNLPLSTRNYTQILSLSPGVSGNVENASGFGNNSQDVNVNGQSMQQNNYQMDGAPIDVYASGSAGVSAAAAPIGIPNPDSIQEFKVQTGQYDASYGRNPGANVDVVTKGGTNNFHGDAWEFFRNNFLNANDFFLKNEQLAQGLANSPQTLKQNQFGFTLGGPIKKNKLFFFGSYQGTRQINGISAGYSPGVYLPPFTNPATGDRGQNGDLAAYTNYLETNPAFNNFIFGNPTSISPVIANAAGTGLLQQPGPKNRYNQGYFIPGAPAGCAFPCVTNIEDPATANEDQYIGNLDYVISSRNTLSERYFYSHQPQVTPFACIGACMPGSPETNDFRTHEGTLKLTTVVSGNFVNEARLSFQRNYSLSLDNWNVTACGIGMAPSITNGQPCSGFTPPANTNPDVLKIPAFFNLGIGDPGGFSFASNPFAQNLNATNTFQGGDQFSWTHGKQTIRAGVDVERDQWNYNSPSGARGDLLIPSLTNLLEGTPGSIITALFTTREPATGVGAAVRVNAFDSYIQDDIKVTPRLTANVGLRWEYDGMPTDANGLLSNNWENLFRSVNTGSYFLSPQGQTVGTLAGYVVQSNYNSGPYGFLAPTGASGVFVNSNETLQPNYPWANFAPRLGVAWQPTGSGKLVLRAGYGMFYDRLYGNLIGYNLIGEPPYAIPIGANEAAQPLSNPYAPTFTPPCPGTGGPCPALGWLPRTLSSALLLTPDSQYLGVPLVQEYNAEVQYEFAPNWVTTVGYTGSHGVRLYDFGRNMNVDYLVAGAPNTPAGLPNEVPASALPFNDPANSTPVLTNLAGNAGPAFQNQLNRAPYLGLDGGTGLGITSTDGSSLYDALDVMVKHQFANGLDFQAAYTWSKLITDINSAESVIGGSYAGNVRSGAMNSGNSLNAAQQYGLAAYNRPQRLIVSYSYDLPWKSHGWSEKMLGGWTVSGVTTIQDGEPFSVTDANGSTIYGFLSGSGQSRAQLADPVGCNSFGVCKSGVPTGTAGSTECRLGGLITVPGCPPPASNPGWINTAAFAPAGSEPCVGGQLSGNPGPYTGTCTGANPQYVNAGTAFGNSGVGIVMGPGQFNFDMALIKLTHITEGTQLEFRAEAFNLFNHPQFNPPAAVDVTSSTFGDITSMSVNPRIIQFALKFIF